MRTSSPHLLVRIVLEAFAQVCIHSFLNTVHLYIHSSVHFCSFLHPATISLSFAHFSIRFSINLFPFIYSLRITTKK